MNEFILSYDLGTSSMKTSLYTQDGLCVCSTVTSYQTRYGDNGEHEQKPQDWWQAIVSSTKTVLESSVVETSRIQAIALSGQSLTVVPLDASGNLLQEFVPIWSDSSARRQVAEFFSQIDEHQWYMKTGNGFSRECYPVFKIMKLRQLQPEIFQQTATVLGSKDYINFLLTGRVATDYSYASGLGAYDLDRNEYCDEYLKAARIPRSLLPEIMASTDEVGTLTSQAAAALGMGTHVRVFCGGVDNSCMALGAGVYESGGHYLSLGSSAWIAVSTSHPITDPIVKPFIFSHVVSGMYTSATAIFSAGSTFRWFKEQLPPPSDPTVTDVYDQLVSLAMQSSIGAHGLLFNPSLGGIPASYHTPDIKGGFYGLELGHTYADLVRAVLEGICIDLATAHKRLANITELSDEMIMVGGGSKNPDWRQMFADTFNMTIVKTAIDQDAASLGAAAIAAVGMGWWSDFSTISRLSGERVRTEPELQNARLYARLQEICKRSWSAQSELGRLTDTYKEVAKESLQ